MIIIHLIRPRLPPSVAHHDAGGGGDGDSGNDNDDDGGCDIEDDQNDN